jgi:hypothetical protein
VSAAAGLHLLLYVARAQAALLHAAAAPLHLPLHHEVLTGLVRLRGHHEGEAIHRASHGWVCCSHSLRCSYQIRECISKVEDRMNERNCS